MNKTKAIILSADASMYPYPYRNHSLTDMEGEIWKPVPSFEQYYMVSNLGRVKSLPRIVYYHNGKKRFMKERIVAQQKGRASILKNGRTSMVCLYTNTKIDGIRYCFIVSRIVYSAFVKKLNPAEANTLFVLHYDLDSCNNKIENLYLANRKEHSRRNIEAELNPVIITTPEVQINKKKAISKPISQYSLSGNFIRSFPSIIEAKRQTKINDKSIIHSAQGKGSHAGGYIWRYETNIENPEKKNSPKGISPIKIAVNQYDASGRLTGTYQTIQKASKILHYGDSGYRKLVKLLREGGGIAIFKGYLWKYATL